MYRLQIKFANKLHALFPFSFPFPISSQCHPIHLGDNGQAQKIACQRDVRIAPKVGGLTIEGSLNLVNVETAYGRSNQAISARRECGEESTLIGGQLVDRLDLVEIERKFAGDAAVESGLQVGGPVVGQQILSTHILLAHPCDARIDSLAAVDVFHGGFTEKEIHVLPNIKGADKVWFCELEKRKIKR